MPSRRDWRPEELLLAFRLYCHTPFGRLHQHNPEIIELSAKLARTPSAIAMKACNFASLDPVQRERNIKALGNVSRADRNLWEHFLQSPEEVAAKAEAAHAQITGLDAPPTEAEIQFPSGPTETSRVVRIRRIQSFFRDAVLVSYENRCALSGLAITDLLNASHIIPWSEDVERRADPRNGIALNVLYDRAFDRGLITFDSALRVVLSPRLKSKKAAPFHREALLSIDGRKLRAPTRFSPDFEALRYHRERIFRAQ